MSHLVGSISRWQGVGLLATALLGTSVFILPQLTVEMAGTSALWSWVGLILAMLPVTLVFARLGQRYPDAGGPAYFIELAFGSQAGASIGMAFLFAAPIGMPVAMMMTFEFAHALMPLTAFQALLGQLLVLAGMWWLNLKGLQVSGRLQLGLTVVILVVVFAILALVLPSSSVDFQASFPTEATFVAAGVAIWSYLGLEAMSHLSADFRDPERDFIPAMVWATVIVGVIYVAITLLVLSSSSEAGLTMVERFDYAFGGGGAWVIGCLGFLAGLATMNTYINAMSRLMWSLAGQQRLPNYFHHLTDKGTPDRALMALVTVMAISLILSFVLAADFDTLLPLVNGLFVVIYLLVMLAGWRLLTGKDKTMAAVGAVVSLLMGYTLGWSMLYGVSVLAFVFLCVAWQQRRMRLRGRLG